MQARRKTYAVLLLVSFLGIIVHDLLPHHHFSEEHNHTHVVYENADHAEHEIEIDSQTECSIYETFLSSSHDHNCPHSFHKCSTADLDFNKSENGTKNNSVVAKTVFLHRNPHNLQTENLQLNAVNYTPVFNIHKCEYHRTSSHRGPPVIA